MFNSIMLSDDALQEISLSSKALATLDVPEIYRCMYDKM